MKWASARAAGRGVPSGSNSSALELDIGYKLTSTGTITLLDKSGVILARSVDNDSAVGRDVSATPLFQDMDARRRVQGVRKVEGLKRLC